MRIAFTVHKYPPESLGGTEIYTEGLARALVERGHQVSVFVPAADQEGADRGVAGNGVHLWRTSRGADGNPITQFWHTFRSRTTETAFADFLQATQPQIVHFQHVQGVSAKLLELAGDLPKVVTLHDYWYFCANSQLIRPDRQPCAGPSAGCRNCVDCAASRADLGWLRVLRPLTALPLAYRNRYLADQVATVDRFVAPSEFLRQQYIGQDFPAERILMIENGIETARLAAHDGDLLSPPDRPHFGFLGTLAWQKGVHILVEAFNQLPAHAALTIYGNEGAFPDYVAELKALARHPQIRFAGAISPDQVGAALRSFDCLVTPSLWYENSPLVIQEAYTVGTPVVASNLGALAEKVDDGVTGALFPPGDSQALGRLLAALVEHPEQLESWRARIQPAPTMAHHAQLIEELYTSLLAETPAKTSQS